MKARQAIGRVTGALMVLVAAGSLGAQSNTNTQRPLRPGQTKGPNFMVPVFRSQERQLGVQVADVVRDRLMSDNLMTSMWVIPKKDLIANLEQSGYSGTDALSTNDLRQLAQFVRAEEYVDGVVTRNADGTITMSASLNLPRGEGMEQPFPAITGAKPGDVAAKMSDEIEKARKQIKGANDCMQSQRQRQYDEAKAHAAKALKEYPNGVFPRICLLEIAFAQRSGPDELIRISEEILSVHPENDRALKVAVDNYGAKAATDKAFEEKYIATLQKLLAADPTNTTLQGQIVNALARSGKFAMAKPIIDEAVKQSPGDPELVKLQWNVYRALNDWKGAITVGEEMIRHDTAAADTMFFQQLVAAYLSDSQPVKAQEAAYRGATRHASSVTLWMSAAQLARQNGQIPQALEAINRALALNPKTPGVRLQKAAIFSEQNNLDSLKAVLRDAVANGEDKAVAGGMYLSKANALLQAYQRDSAKTVDAAERVLTEIGFADSLNATETTGFLKAVAQLNLGQMLLTRASEAKSCDDAKRTNDLLISSQDLIRKNGRQFGASAGQAMQGAIQLQDYADRAVKAFCKAPVPSRT